MVTRIEVGPGSLEDDRCVCGAIHRVPLDRVVIGDDAIDQLVGYAQQRRWSRPFVVMDANTKEVAGARVVDLLSGAGTRATTLCFPERSGMLADQETVSRLEEALRDSGSDSIVSVGSGVITDLTRYVAGGMGREFVSVPTAASMDGYASGVSVMEFGGMKKSYPADPPVAIFAEPRILAAAPYEMTRAGLGDLLGKASAGTDWLASHALYGEERCPEVARLVTDALMRAANEVDDILGGSPAATARLLQGLVESGLAIAMVGSSRPASGSEHQVSHFWDLLAAEGRRPHSPHGLQVGYATHFAMRLQLHAFGGGSRELAVPRPLVAGDEIERVVRRPLSAGGGRNGGERAVSRRTRIALARRRVGLGSGVRADRRSPGRLPPRCRSVVRGGHPSGAGFLGARRGHAQGELPLGEPDPFSLQRPGLLGRPGQPRRHDRCRDRFGARFQGRAIMTPWPATRGCHPCAR